MFHTFFFQLHSLDHDDDVTKIKLNHKLIKI